MVNGRALEMLRSLGGRDDRSGYEAYRHIVAAYEPKSATLAMGLLQKVPSHVLFRHVGIAGEDLLIWEQDVERYASLCFSPS